MGHLAVPFKSMEEGKFEVDKDAMMKNVEKMNEHIKNGGCAGWYPEGAVNRGDPHQVGLFRAGGFAPIVNNDVELWCLAGVGNSQFWPPKAAVGGRPCKIGYKAIQICKSSKEFYANVEAPAGKDLDRARCEYIANYARTQMQAGIDD